MQEATGPGEEILSEAEIEAIEEREAIQFEPALDDESDEVGDIPGWDEVDTAATSPNNDLPIPSEAQQKVGNFKMAHITIKGIPITIQYPMGSMFRGRGQVAHRGDIKGIKGKDNDDLDVFVNPNIQTDYDNKVYVIDQMEQDTNQFDEHKVMLGYANQFAAVRAYRQTYGKKQKVGPVVEMTMPEFKKWINKKAKLTQPASQDKFFGLQSRESGRAAKGKVQELKDIGRDLRYSRGRKTQISDVEVTVKDSEMVNAPNEAWISSVLSTRERKSAKTGETAAMNSLVDQLIKVTERRKALDKRAKPRNTERRKYGRRKLERDIAPLEKSMPGAPVTVLNNYKEASPMVVAGMEAQNMTEVKAVTDPQTGEIYLFSDRITSKDEAVRATIHEKVHMGLRKFLGKDLDPILQDLWNNVPANRKKAMDNIVERYNIDVTKPQDQMEAAEELIAHMAESDPKNNFVQQVIAKIRQALRRAGVDMGTWTDAEIIDLIQESRGSLKRAGNDRIAGVTFDEDVEIEDTGEIFTIEQDAGEMLAQQAKRIENVNRLKACL
jgi:hypothetical protein